VTRALEAAVGDAPFQAGMFEALRGRARFAFLGFDPYNRGAELANGLWAVRRACEEDGGFRGNGDGVPQTEAKAEGPVPPVH
jgi:hypothetical protein